MGFRANFVLQDGEAADRWR